MLFFRSIIAVSILTLISIAPSSFAGETEKDDSTLAAEKQEKLKQSESKAKADSIDCPDYPGPDEFVPMEIMPELISDGKPVYPDSLKKAGVKGSVWVKCKVDERGDVICAMVGKTSGNKMLDRLAIDSAYKSKFKPGIQNGMPVRAWVTYPVDFGVERKGRRR